MSKAVQLYPHRVSTALRLRLADFDDPETGRAVSVHGTRDPGPAEVEDDAAEPERGPDAYDACSAAGSWRKLTFRLTAELPAAELARVLPSTSDVATDAALVVSITCQATKYRHGVRLARTKAGHWSGHATLQRSDVSGVVALVPRLVRVTGIPASEDLPVATRVGSVLATGDSVALYVDVPPSAVLHSTVMTAWEDFADSDHAWRREHSDDVFHLEPYGAVPRLYLNSHYAQLRQLLESEAKRGPEASLRDLTAAMIAQPALLQLATVALTSLEPDEDSGAVQSPSGWRGDLLASVLPRLYPEEASADARLRRAAREVRDADGAPGVQARLGSVVQDMIAAFKTIEAAARAHEASREREELPDA